MLLEWLLEIVIGIGKLFLHPLLYWTVILLMITGYRRIKRERYKFGTKLYDMFAESKGTLGISILFSIIISIFSITFGFVFSYEVIVILLLVTILLSITGSLTMLSASYTIGITFLILMLLPYLNVDLIQALGIGLESDQTIVYLISLAILTGLFLLVEALLVTSKNARTFPRISLSERGKWVGQHHLKRLAFIPFFVFLPTEQISVIAPLFPYFYYGEQSFSLLFIPFIVGFHYKIQGDLPQNVSQKLGRQTFTLSGIVLAFSIGSLFYPLLALVAIVLAIVGKEWITYRHRTKDRKKQVFFSPVNHGLRVLAVHPNSPADRIGVQIGEIIHKVNGTTVRQPKEFYEALQSSGPFFQLDILDVQGEVRFVKSAFYEADHHELGIIFPEIPYQVERTKKSS